jgi:hypothetical protein
LITDPPQGIINPEGGWTSGGILLGEKVFEGRGRFVYYKILRNGKWEDTEEYRGDFLGERSVLKLTAEGENGPDGKGVCEFCGVLNGSEGSRGRFIGVGSVTVNPNGRNSWRGSFCFSGTSGRFSRLNGMAVAFEGEWEEDDLRMNAWEWK